MREAANESIPLKALSFYADYIVLMVNAGIFSTAMIISFIFFSIDNYANMAKVYNRIFYSICKNIIIYINGPFKTHGELLSFSFRAIEIEKASFICFTRVRTGTNIMKN